MQIIKEIFSNIIVTWSKANPIWKEALSTKQMISA